MAKLFEVAIQKECTEYAYIWAEDRANAIEIAGEIIGNIGLETIESGDGWDNEEIADVKEFSEARLDKEGKKNAKTNLDAYREYIAEDGASI